MRFEALATQGFATQFRRRGIGVVFVRRKKGATQLLFNTGGLIGRFLVTCCTREKEVRR